MIATSPSRFRVLVCDQLSSALVDSDLSQYLSPPQPEAQARRLICLLLGRSSANGTGPWRQAIAGGQRLIELTPDP